MKRGRYNRPFLHLTSIGLLAVGVLIAPFLSDTFPVFAQNSSALDLSSPSSKQSVLAGEEVFQTQISEKPRDKIIDYIVQKGDTVETVAKKFNISTDTIRWANDLNGDNLNVGDTLKILPVTGIAHKVEAGDTVYTIAKKYDANPQAIVDFPFNEFANAETFSLVTGQIIIVPDGLKPSEKSFTPRRIQHIAQEPGIISSGGLSWPVPGGGISQYAGGFHMALDITSPIGTPVYASQNGIVTRVSSGTWDTGYGTNIWVSDGNGTETHYAHLDSLSLSVGNSVIAGKTVVGLSGSTGRSTGPHTHFEIRKSGVLVNPLPFVQK